MLALLSNIVASTAMYSNRSACFRLDDLAANIRHLIFFPFCLLLFCLTFTGWWRVFVLCFQKFVNGKEHFLETLRCWKITTISLVVCTFLSNWSCLTRGATWLIHLYLCPQFFLHIRIKFRFVDLFVRLVFPFTFLNLGDNYLFTRI